MVSRPRGRAGFTLPEALVALTISSVLVLLVGTVLLVQNDFYSHVLLRSQVQENARAMNEFVAGELRSTTKGAFILADSTRLVVRSPIVPAAVCADQGNDAIVHVVGGLSAIDTTEVAGFGYRNPTTGVWSYYDRTWAQLKQNGGNPALQCYNQGADTTGARPFFMRMNYIDDDTGVTAANLRGAVLMLYRKTEFRFNSSSLVSGDRSLYWGIYGQTLRELVTGVSTSAHFEFRTGANTWVKEITGASLANINGVRIQAESVGKGETSGESTYNFGYSVDIPLPNTY